MQVFPPFFALLRIKRGRAVCPPWGQQTARPFFPTFAVFSLGYSLARSLLDKKRLHLQPAATLPHLWAI